MQYILGCLLRRQCAVPQVHQGLAEQSYRHQVQTIMGDGQLTQERAEALTGVLPFTHVANFVCL